MNKNVETIERVYTRIHTSNLKDKKTRKENTKGITLVALVVTIIILLILAGISIAGLIGSGLFEKTKEAKQEFDNSQTKENSTLNGYEQEIEQYLNKNKNDYNDFKKWLSYVGLENKYNSISDLLQNSTDLNTVMNKKESIDYMIKSTGTIMEEVVKSEIAIKEISKSNEAAKKVIEDDIWFNAIQKSKYSDTFDEGAITIPELTDNTSNGIVTGTAVASSAYKLYYPFTSKEPVTTSGANVWCPKVCENSWVAYEFNLENNINIYKLKFNSNAEKSNPSRWFFPKKYILQCKANDGDDNEPSNWTNCSPIFEISDITENNNIIESFSEKKWWKVTNYFRSNVYGKKFRFFVYESSGIYLNINQLQIYGRY